MKRPAQALLGVLLAGSLALSGASSPLASGCRTSIVTAVCLPAGRFEVTWDPSVVVLTDVAGAVWVRPLSESEAAIGTSGREIVLRFDWVAVGDGNVEICDYIGVQP